jgi:hypothetical protein
MYIGASQSYSAHQLLTSRLSLILRLSNTLHVREYALKLPLGRERHPPSTILLDRLK